MTALIRPWADERTPSRLAPHQRCISCWCRVSLSPVLIDMVHQQFAIAQCSALLEAVFLCDGCEARCCLPPKALN